MTTKAYSRYFFLPSSSAVVMLKKIIEAERIPEVQSMYDKTIAEITPVINVIDFASFNIFSLPLGKNAVMVVFKPIAPIPAPMFEIAM